MVADDAVEPEPEPEPEDENEEAAKSEPSPKDDGAPNSDASSSNHVERLRGFGSAPGFTGANIAGMASALGAIAAATGAYSDAQEQMIRSLAPALAAINAQTQQSIQSIAKSIINLNSANMYPSIDGVTALLRHMSELPALTQLRDYTALDDPTSAYSNEMESPQSYFQSTEQVITCFDDLHAAISRLIAKTSDLPLVWRGVRNADWGLHSHLYRQLMISNEVKTTFQQTDACPALS